MNLFPPLNPMPPIPWGPKHPGAFGINCHQHVHTGIDLYAPHGSPVRAMGAGKIIKIDWFTGPSIDMPWWNDTRAVYVEGETGVFCYGEIQELSKWKTGDTVNKGDYLGYVLTVLRKYKGRPMSMLHLELYDHGYTDTWSEWKIGDPKPEHLRDPYEELIRKLECDFTFETEDPYKESVQIWKESQCHSEISVTNTAEA